MEDSAHSPDIITARMAAVRTRMADAERRYGRLPGSVELLAISKHQPVEIIEDFVAAGVMAYGENYLQEALPKVAALAGRGITWHFTGALQSNKTQSVAQHFDWVHSVDRLKLAERLNAQRPLSLPPLNICIQIKVGDEAQKAGIALEQAAELAEAVAGLPRLSLRGLMVLPPPAGDFGLQRHYFRETRECFEDLKRRGLPLDTLSMGMSSDLEAAIAEGATLVRIGTALFGERPRKR